MQVASKLRLCLPHPLISHRGSNSETPECDPLVELVRGHRIQVLWPVMIFPHRVRLTLVRSAGRERWRSKKSIIHFFWFPTAVLGVLQILSSACWLIIIENLVFSRPKSFQPSLKRIRDPTSFVVSGRSRGNIPVDDSTDHGAKG